MDTLGFPMKEAYGLGLRFLKEKEGKAFHLKYEDKLILIGHSMLIKHGPYDAEKAPQIGFLDVVGHDRRKAWQQLGNMSKEDGLTNFLKRLDELCPTFKPFLEAHKVEAEAKRISSEQGDECSKSECKQQITFNCQVERAQIAEASMKADYLRKMQHETQLRAALNRQTTEQFRQYAQQQHPNDIKKQDELIVQLQEQHFQQYIEQVYQQQLLHQTRHHETLQTQGCPNTTPQSRVNGASHNLKVDTNGSSLPNAVQSPNQSENPLEIAVEAQESGSDIFGAVSSVSLDLDTGNISGSTADQSLVAPSMWVRKDVDVFKAGLANDKDAMIKVGSGEVVTVRVPTHSEGSCIFWEFATDGYDIGFGLFFEWGEEARSLDNSHESQAPHSTEPSDKEPSQDPPQETQQINGSSQIGDQGSGQVADQGSGQVADQKEISSPPQRLTDEIIPVYRRDCQTDVYCGSHHYPGKGVYLLKFDNSYSLWRSKWLYYRVYYTR